MNAFTPTTPHAASSRRRSTSASTSPPHSAKSTTALSDAASYFRSNAFASIVGGTEFSGMSAMVVVPPAAAPRVAASHPSQPARPGSLTCTCASTTPGRTTMPRASISSRASPVPGATRPMITRSRIMMSASITPSDVTTRPPRIARSATLAARPPRHSGDLFDREVQRALPQHLAAELREALVPLDHRREVISCELPHLAREAAGAVWKEDLHLRDPAGIDQDLARRGMAGVVLVVDADALLTHRHPGRLSAPAHVHELAPEGQQLPNRGARLRRAL